MRGKHRAIGQYVRRVFFERFGGQMDQKDAVYWSGTDFKGHATMSAVGAVRATLGSYERLPPIPFTITVARSVFDPEASLFVVHALFDPRRGWYIRRSGPEIKRAVEARAVMQALL